MRLEKDYPLNITRKKARFQAILDQVEYREWDFILNRRGDDFFLHVEFSATDATEPKRIQAWKGRKWLLSEHMTDSELIGTAFKAVMTAVEHETREFFKFQGAAVYNPHISIFALRDVSGDVDVRS